jgi:predicted dehydrogenase
VANPSQERCLQFPQLASFRTGQELIASDLVDAVIISTPHYQHVDLGIAALEAGLHVLVEKPIAAHKADAERLIAAAARHPKQVFAAMFQMRVEPRYLATQKLIREELGAIVRVTWLLTDWFRTESYYASGGWRATWQGEGGGVLLNQCLHQLDMLQWLIGMPSRVRGFCRLGRFHHIEVEDDVTAYLEFPGGVTGVLVTSTGEAPGANRLEITGSRGALVLEHDRLLLTRNYQDMFEFTRTAPSGFARPDHSTEEIPFQDADTPHALVTHNFVEAIRRGTPLIAPGAEGIHSLELANAILYSSLIDRAVDLPLDSAAYKKKLDELIAGSTIRKQGAPSRTEDPSGSFRR